MRWSLLMLLGIVSTAAAAPAGIPPGYTLHKSIVLEPKSDGMDGTLQLLEDSRITMAIRSELAGTDTGLLCDGPDDKPTQDFCALLQGKAPLPAIVRLVGADGKLWDSRKLERELVDVDTEHLYGDARITYLVTVDMGVGMGSYAGPMTRFAEIDGKKLRWVQAQDIDGASDEIVVSAALKSAWKVVPSTSGTGKDILEVDTRLDRPGAAADGSDDLWQIHYFRFEFVTGRWVLFSKAEKGYIEFEDDNDFPSSDKFPHA